jgi:hypothetical protein
LPLRFAYPQPPHLERDSQDQRAYLKQFRELHRAFATWLTDNPEGELIDRAYLLDAIGFTSFRSGLEQRFPIPEIPYERNHGAAAQIERAIAAISGGYLAVTGPLASENLRWYRMFFPSIRFSFPTLPICRMVSAILVTVARHLPSFRISFSVWITSLKGAAVWASPTLRKAARHFVITCRGERPVRKSGFKTVLLIDGLDYVQREAGLEKPLLLELPRPDEVPD